MHKQQQSICSEVAEYIEINYKDDDIGLQMIDLEKRQYILVDYL
jgi:hypothetical protein